MIPWLAAERYYAETPLASIEKQSISQERLLALIAIAEGAVEFLGYTDPIVWDGSKLNDAILAAEQIP